ncbi:MAG: DUF721 domain-containing protein [Candidatus Omnitrophica bacterium]|nr:DUF721 domain-containing protein [Candidatus Omnitrophota bacterium]
MRDDSPKPIADIISDIIKKTSKSDKKSPVAIEVAWRKSVGEKIIRHAMPISFRNKILVIGVDSSIWLYQLGFLKREILTKLKKSLGEDVISDIFFRIGRM